MNSILSIFFLFLAIGVGQNTADDNEAVRRFPWGYDAPPRPPPPSGDIIDEDTENNNGNRVVGWLLGAIDELKTRNKGKFPWGYDAPPMPPPPTGDIIDEDTENDNSGSGTPTMPPSTTEDIIDEDTENDNSNNVTPTMPPPTTEDIIDEDTENDNSNNVTPTMPPSTTEDIIDEDTEIDNCNNVTPTMPPPTTEDIVDEDTENDNSNNVTPTMPPLTTGDIIDEDTENGNNVTPTMPPPTTEDIVDEDTEIDNGNNVTPTMPSPTTEDIIDEDTEIDNGNSVTPTMPPPTTEDIIDEDTEIDNGNSVTPTMPPPTTGDIVDGDTEIDNGNSMTPTMPPPTTEDIVDEDTVNGSMTERPLSETDELKMPISNGTFDYALLLKMSMEFYEAQRSGPLPSDNPVTWRGDSALNDMGFNNEDLTGGYYDAGDHVKFGLPMAFTTTTLAWGAIRYKSIYEANGQLEKIRETIKWATDYFIKAHVSENEFYTQVGDGAIDHQYWVPPETMTMDRPPRMIDENTAGGDIAGETAAALAASSIVFAHDPSYSDLLLSHAVELFNLGNNTRGCHDNGGYYSQTRCGDELAWAAAWLYKATNNTNFLAAAESLFYEFARARPWAYSWAEKNVGVQLLMYEFTGDSVYEKKVKMFVEGWFEGNNFPFTPDGLAFRDTWGPLRYNAGTCMIALMAAEDGLGVNTTYEDWARGQLHYMLGDNSANQSFVVGFGEKYPVRPHHRASSCKDGLVKNAALTNPDPNPHLLRGALVGGPNNLDEYNDNRQDYISNEVACDYNAAFQTAIAALQYYDTIGRRALNV